MNGYRLYFLDGAGHITGSDEFEATDDAAAIELAEQRRDGHSAELWRAKSPVRVFQGRPAIGVTLFSE